MSVNKVFLRGFVGQDPKQYDSVTKFSLATTEKWKDKSGEWQERTEWHNCVCFGPMAERAMAKVRKGDLVSIDDAKLSTNTYDNKAGQKTTATSIVVNKFEVLNKKEETRQQSLVENPEFDPNEPLPF